MDIKPFDIVKFGGENYRVQSVDECDKEIRLIGGYWVRESDVTLVESVIVPEFQIGDEVIIHPIPGHEKGDYPTGWDSEMSNMVSGQAYKILDYDSLDNSYLISDFWFSPYHLEKIDAYDMI